MPDLEIEIIPVLYVLDNYNFLIHSPETKETAAIDPSLSEPTLERLKEKGWNLTHILSTHHHHDHVGGNLELKEATSCKIVGFEEDAKRIPGIDIGLKANETFSFAGNEVQTIHLPGHTTGGLAYYFPKQEMVFSGDVIFGMGCGKLFEGTAEQMFEAFRKLGELPDQTLVYCGHEYTVPNGEFAVTIEPDNLDIQNRLEEAKALRAKDIPTVPTTIALEKATNPFMRATSPEEFGRIRKLKDNF